MSDPSRDAAPRPPKAERRRSLRAGIKAGIPVAVAVFAVAISYGVVAEPVFGEAATLAMSIFVFAGSAQFGSAAVVAAGGGVPTAVLAAVLLNARYIPMGIALAPSLGGMGRGLRAAYGNAMVDASWAMASRGDGSFDPDYLVGATIPSYPAWIGGTALGIFAGDLIGDPGRARARRPLPRLLPRPAARWRAARGALRRHRRPARGGDRPVADADRAGRCPRHRSERRRPRRAAPPREGRPDARPGGGSGWLTPGSSSRGSS